MEGQARERTYEELLDEVTRLREEGLVARTVTRERINRLGLRKHEDRKRRHHARNRDACCRRDLRPQVSDP